MALADTAKLIASLELQDKFSRPASRAERSMGRLESRSNALGRAGSQASRGLGTMATSITRVGLVAGAAAVVGIAASIHAASDLNEEIDKSAVVFGRAAPEVQAFARGASDIGLATSEALGAAGAFGNMFNTIGFAQDASADMSVTMVQLAADMASFNNEDPSEMLDKLRSGLSGEAEPLRRYGVLLSEATTREFAYRTGIARTGEALTEAQKVQARYGLILEQTAIQQGNFADTSGSLANQQRILRSRIQNLGATFGTQLLPVVTKVVSALNRLFISPAVQTGVERLGRSIAGLFTDDRLNEGIATVESAIARLSSADFGGGEAGGGLARVADSIGGIASQVARLPWESIGNAARLLGTGSKALLDAFLGLPPWVQTAVLTGWGLNKLTGGALSSIVGALASGLIKGILNMNAGVVNINAATVNGGGGVPGGAAGRGIIGGLATGVAIASPLLAAGAAVEVVNFENMRSEQRERLQGILDELPDGPAEINTSISRLQSEITRERPLLEGVLFNTNVRPQLEEQRDELIRTRDTLAANIVRGTDETSRTIDRVNATMNLERAASQAYQAADATRINSLRDSHVAAGRNIVGASDRVRATVAQNGANQLAKQQAIANAVNTNTGVLKSKNFAPKIKVDTHVTSNVTISEIQRKITSQQIATSVATGGGGFAV